VVRKVERRRSAGRLFQAAAAGPACHFGQARGAPGVAVQRERGSQPRGAFRAMRRAPCLPARPRSGHAATVRDYDSYCAGRLHAPTSLVSMALVTSRHASLVPSLALHSPRHTQVQCNALPFHQPSHMRGASAADEGALMYRRRSRHALGGSRACEDATQCVLGEKQRGYGRW
jgi:hypothetical protein